MAAEFGDLIDPAGETVGLKKFVYKPLGRPTDIRVLVLHPPNAGQIEVSCHLEHRFRRSRTTNILNLTDFTAISYTWGDGHLTNYINCAGAHLSVTANVDKMLRQLRRPHKRKYLWIDAICLDQNNFEEKGLQIPLMGDIFREAKKVLIWLGGDGIDYRTHLPKGAAMFRSVREFNLGRPVAYALDDRSPLDPEFQEIENFPDQERKFTATDVQHIEEFLKHPWFTRRWILQERAANSNVVIMYNSETIPWLEFSRALRDGVKQLWLACHDRSVRDVLQLNLYFATSRKSIWDLLLMFHTSNCSQNQDRLAALQSMANPLAFSYPAYTDDWIAYFLEFVTSAIRHGQSAEIFAHLVHFGSLSELNPDWPAIVPCWIRRLPCGKPSLPEVYDISSYKPISPQGRRPETSQVTPYVAGEVWRQSFDCLCARVTVVLPGPTNGSLRAIEHFFVSLLGAIKKSSKYKDKTLTVRKARNQVTLTDDQYIVDRLHLWLVRFLPDSSQFGLIGRWLRGILRNATLSALNPFTLVSYSEASTHPNGLARERGEASFDLLQALYLNDVMRPCLADLLQNWGFFIAGLRTIGVSDQVIKVGDLIIHNAHSQDWMPASEFATGLVRNCNRFMAGHCEILWSLSDKNEELAKQLFDKKGKVKKLAEDNPLPAPLSVPPPVRPKVNEIVPRTLWATDVRDQSTRPRLKTAQHHDFEEWLRGSKTKSIPEINFSPP